jgi:hypothetical protein
MQSLLSCSFGFDLRTSLSTAFLSLALSCSSEKAVFESPPPNASGADAVGSAGRPAVGGGSAAGSSGRAGAAGASLGDGARVSDGGSGGSGSGSSGSGGSGSGGSGSGGDDGGGDDGGGGGADGHETGASGAGGEVGAGGAADGGADGGEVVEVLDCSNERKLVSPLLVNFDDSDPSGPVLAQRFVFNTNGSPMTAVLVPYDDGSGAYALSLVANGVGGYVVRGANPAARLWGGGVKLSVPCLDASQFTGVAFRIEGRTPRGTAEFSLTIDGLQYVGHTFALPSGWTDVKVPFSALRGTGGSPPGLTTNGRKITEVTFSAQLNYVQQPGGWVATPGAFDIGVDAISFY